MFHHFLLSRFFIFKPGPVKRLTGRNAAFIAVKNPASARMPNLLRAHAAAVLGAAGVVRIAVADIGKCVVERSSNSLPPCPFVIKRTSPYWARIGIADRTSVIAIPESSAWMSLVCLPIVLAKCGKPYQTRSMENQCHVMAYNFRNCQSVFTFCNFFSL